MIELPDWVSPQSVTPGYKDYGFNTVPITGGSITRTNRPGNRWMLKVALPPVKTDLDGQALISDLVRAKREGLRFRWPLGAFSPVPQGLPFVDGSGQSGASLAISGLEPNTVLRKGQFFSFEQAGRSYLHQIQSEVIADTVGSATITIEPELRVITVDLSPCEFEQPVIDGIVIGDDWEWELSLSKYAGLSFDLLERY